MKFWIFPILLVLGSAFLFPPQPAEALCVKSKRANLRQGPDTKFQKLWEVLQYMPFKKLKKKNNWYRVKDVDGDIYWIYGKLVTEKYKCAVVKKNKTNLRTGPGTKHSKVPWAPVDKYFSMKVLKIEKNWVHIVDMEGDKAWIYKPLVWIQ